MKYPYPRIGNNVFTMFSTHNDLLMSRDCRGTYLFENPILLSIFSFRYIIKLENYIDI